jgi:hypothetical protein
MEAGFSSGQSASSIMHRRIPAMNYKWGGSPDEPWRYWLKPAKTGLGGQNGISRPKISRQEPLGSISEERVISKHPPKSQFRRG